MDYYNLCTASIWHLNPDGSGFEKIDGPTLNRLGGAFRNLRQYAMFPRFVLQPSVTDKESI